MSDITYTWKVNNVKCYKDLNGYQDYVYQTYWNCAAATLGPTGQAYDASFAGAARFGTEPVDSGFPSALVPRRKI